MRKTISVIAADGRTGRVFVQSALDAGLNVRAGIHGGMPLPSHKNLTIVECDATNSDDVRRLLKGTDAVISLIGHGKYSPSTVQTDAMITVVNTMNELGITRLVSLTGTGVRQPDDTPNLIDRLLNISIKLIDPKRIDDGVKHAKYLQSTDIDWTVLRVLKLTNGISTGNVKFSLSGPAELFTPRARVAKAILQVLTEESYICAMPIIQGVER